MYIGRLAPSPTGYLHLGHARTFHAAWLRARAKNGQLRLRIDDLDRDRCKPEYVDACLQEFHWMGIAWDGEPMYQSQRTEFYLAAWRCLAESGLIYPCTRSRKDVAAAAGAPHEDGGEAIYPPAWRQASPVGVREPGEANWRFRVPDGRRMSFVDAEAGACSFTAGEDFGDFIVWRRDATPAYEMAVVVDDAEMGVTEVVRGEDLLLSTARQFLVYEALGLAVPAYAHLPLVCDADGRRLAKRDGAMGLRQLRAEGRTFADCLRELDLESQ